VQVTNQQGDGIGGLDRDAFTGVVSRAINNNGAIVGPENPGSGLVTQFSTTLWEGLQHDTGISNSDLITNNDTLIGSGVADAVVHFTIDGVSIAATTTADSNGAWTFTPPALSDGTHTVVASETDSASNTRAASLTFTLDTTPPYVAITSDTLNKDGSRSRSPARRTRISLRRYPPHLMEYPPRNNALSCA
jgi:hypothetical protein